VIYLASRYHEAWWQGGIGRLVDGDQRSRRGILKVASIGSGAKFMAAALLVAASTPVAGSAQSGPTPQTPTFGNPTISGIQGYGFEQDLRLDTHGRVYTSAPGGLGSGLSYLWRSLDGGQTFKWVPAAAQPSAPVLSEMETSFCLIAASNRVTVSFTNGCSAWISGRRRLHVR